MTQTSSKDHKPKLITVNIDGEDFQVDDREQTPRELLTLAGLDPQTTYLSELRGHQHVSLKDTVDQPIKLHNNMRFLSADIGSAPVA